MTIFGFGIIILVIGLIITGIGGGIWIIARIRRRKRIEAPSPGVSTEMISNRQQEEEKKRRSVHT
jgi:hypothetical protein